MCFSLGDLAPGFGGRAVPPKGRWVTWVLLLHSWRRKVLAKSMWAEPPREVPSRQQLFSRHLLPA